MLEVVYNSVYGGFGLSERAMKELGLKTGYDVYKLSRSDPRLVDVVKRLGDEAGDKYCKLKIQVIDDTDPSYDRYYLEEYDGLETVIVERNKLLGLVKNLLEKHPDDTGPVANCLREYMLNNRNGK